MIENLPKRKVIRLSKYDYSKNGYYFVTICTRDKQPIFWKPVGADIIRPQQTKPESPVGADIIRPHPHPRQQTCADDDGRLINGRNDGRLVAASTEMPHIRLSEYGKIVDEAIQNIPSIYPNVSVDTYVIMPDHIHMILAISGSVLPEQGTSPPNLMCVVGQMKRWASQKAGIPLWQKSFYEHIIRNYDDYINTVKYIMQNPKKLMLHL